MDKQNQSNFWNKFRIYRNLSLSINSKQKGKMVELAGNEDIYKGDIFFEDGKLIEKRDSRYSEWVIQDGRLSLIPYKIRKDSSTKVLNNKILLNTFLNINKHLNLLKVGGPK
ncbi:hypothetical protein SAMN04487897_10426 [Paenibacillus sp. yr247]|uniref:hypothetical protein n=1 Tax=Paenibacillus sp. yr247 TaxID=1761880 RepID=UPI00088E689D|nr:hypothetical protein [Paenibacillus sp. yr247]SDN67090.1 hypothetical protein SAMN04487897_10426 [Paenibacillus sp. yr247]